MQKASPLSGEAFSVCTTKNIADGYCFMTPGKAAHVAAQAIATRVSNVTD